MAALPICLTGIWDLGFLRHAPLRGHTNNRRFDRRAVDFFESMSGQRVQAATRVDSKIPETSHKDGSALGAAQTRYIERHKRCTPVTHMRGGMRTAMSNGAHVEYFRGLFQFPTHRREGGPSMSAEWRRNDSAQSQNQPGP